MVLVGLSIILTFYSMSPVFSQMWEMGSVPYQKNGDMVAAIQEGSKPLKEFMLKQTREQDLEFFIKISKGRPAQNVEEITLWEAAPAAGKCRTPSNRGCPAAGFSARAASRWPPDPAWRPPPAGPS